MVLTSPSDRATEFVWKFSRLDSSCAWRAGRVGTEREINVQFFAGVSAF